MKITFLTFIFFLKINENTIRFYPMIVNYRSTCIIEKKKTPVIVNHRGV